MGTDCIFHLIKFKCVSFINVIKNCYCEYNYSFHENFKNYYKNVMCIFGCSILLLWNLAQEACIGKVDQHLAIIR